MMLTMLIAVGCSGKSSSPEPANNPASAANEPASTEPEAEPADSEPAAPAASAPTLSPLITEVPEGASERMVEKCKPGEPIAEMTIIGIQEYKGELYCRVEWIKDETLWIYFYDEEFRPSGWSPTRTAASWKST